jgi:hypothetical protein
VRPNTLGFAACFKWCNRSIVYHHWMTLESQVSKQAVCRRVEWSSVWSASGWFCSSCRKEVWLKVRNQTNSSSAKIVSLFKNLIVRVDSQCSIEPTDASLSAAIAKTEVEMKFGLKASMVLCLTSSHHLTECFRITSAQNHQRSPSNTPPHPT